MKVIADEFQEVIAAANETFPHGGAYTLEKIRSFLSYLKCAVMPVDGSDKPPAECLELAGSDLEKVENSLPN